MYKRQQYTYASEDRVEATMPVDERTRQPFGILHGGATLALAETVAGLGSMILAKPDEIVVGMQVSGNHMSSAHEEMCIRDRVGFNAIPRQARERDSFFSSLL